MVGAGEAGGRRSRKAPSRPVLGVFGVDLLGDLEFGDGGPPMLFLVFGMGNAGRATVGGPLDGREGPGSPVDMLTVSRQLPETICLSSPRCSTFLPDIMKASRVRRSPSRWLERHTASRMKHADQLPKVPGEHTIFVLKGGKGYLEEQ